MTEFKPGDRVRVTYEATWDQDRGTHYWLRDLTDGTTTSAPNTATVELIEPVDDPSKDPAGTVRSSAPTGKGGIWVKRETRSGAGLWTYVAGHYGQESMAIPDGRVQGWEVIGFVPGTPAAEAQKPREPWTGDGDGDEEPPAHVQVVKDESNSALKYLVRGPQGGWNWNEAPTWDEEEGDAGFAWGVVARIASGILTEVRAR